jgi:VanZ family protein
MIPSSAIPSVQAPFGFDKLIHFFLFFIFALIYLGDYRNDKKRYPPLVYSIFTMLVFILISELLQLLTRTRHFEFMDILAGAGGAFTALAIHYAIHPDTRNKKN